MNSAFRNHDPGDGNAHNAASERLKMIVESTRADIDQVLEELDKKLLNGAPRTPNTLTPPAQIAYPEPYRALNQFHYPARPPTYPDSLHTQRHLYTGNATSRNNQMSYTHKPRNRRPDQSTQAETPRQNGRATVRNTPAPSPSTGTHRQLGIEPASTRSAGRQIFQHTPQVIFDRPTPDVVLKRSTTTSIYKPGETWNKTTTNRPPGAVVSSMQSNPRKDRRYSKNQPDEDILHICHKMQGTFPVIQAHYNNNHGYEPQRRSPSSSPEPLRSQKRGDDRRFQTEDPPLLHIRLTGMQRKEKLVNQSSTRAINIQLECAECGFQTGDPSSLRMHQAGMHSRTEYLVTLGNIRTAELASDQTHKKNQIAESRNKLTEAAHNQPRDDNILVNNNEGVTAMRQTLGSLKFPPINPGNANQEIHDECGEQPVTNTTKMLKLAPNPDGTQTVMKKVTPTAVPPAEMVILEVEDITVDVNNEKNHNTQHDVAPKPHQNTELHHSPVGPQQDIHEPCGATSYYVHRQTDEQIHPTGLTMAPEVMKRDTRFPPKTPHDKNNRDTSAEIRTTANAEIANICSTILLGKVNAAGSFNVNGQVMSIQELQKQIGNLQDRN